MESGDEIDDLITALMWRVGDLAGQIVAADGGGPKECEDARCMAALRVHWHLDDLPVEELRRQAALIDGRLTAALCDDGTPRRAGAVIPGRPWTP